MYLGNYTEDFLAIRIWLNDILRYQNILRICVWAFFLFAYSQAVREPLDTIHRDHSDLDPWEIVMYVMGLAFTLEGSSPLSRKNVMTLTVCLVQTYKRSSSYFCLSHGGRSAFGALFLYPRTRFSLRRSVFEWLGCPLTESNTRTSA